MLYHRWRLASIAWSPLPVFFLTPIDPCHWPSLLGDLDYTAPPFKWEFLNFFLFFDLLTCGLFASLPPWMLKYSRTTSPQPKPSFCPCDDHTICPLFSRGILLKARTTELLFISNTLITMSILHEDLWWSCGTSRSVLQGLRLDHIGCWRGLCRAFPPWRTGPENSY